jgi:hypothetical protein
VCFAAVGRDGLLWTQLSHHTTPASLRTSTPARKKTSYAVSHPGDARLRALGGARWCPPFSSPRSSKFGISEGRALHRRLQPGAPHSSLDTYLEIDDTSRFSAHTGVLYLYLLILVGKHGVWTSSLAGIIGLGSVSDYVTHHARTPSLLVLPRHTYPIHCHPAIDTFPRAPTIPPPATTPPHPSHHPLHASPPVRTALARQGSGLVNETHSEQLISWYAMR